MSRLTAIILFASLTGCISSVNMSQGIVSFKQQDYRQAFVRLLPEAEKGNPEAEYAVGYMYYYGEGVTEDREKAIRWIRLAATAGQPDAIIAMKAIKKR